MPKAIPLVAIPHCLTSTGIYTHKYTYIPTKANRDVARDETVHSTERLTYLKFVSQTTAFSHTIQTSVYVRDVNTEQN